MKHKIGDKVRIRKDLVVGRNYGAIRFFRGMESEELQTVVVEVDDSDDSDYLDNNLWYSGEMLED